MGVYAARRRGGERHGTGRGVQGGGETRRPIVNVRPSAVMMMAWQADGPEVTYRICSWRGDRRGARMTPLGRTWRPCAQERADSQGNGGALGAPP